MVHCQVLLGSCNSPWVEDSISGLGQCIHSIQIGSTNLPLDPNTCLKIKKALYATSIAPRLWWLHLRETLLSIGMKESPRDQCLLYRPGFLMIVYFDDAGITAPTMQGIHHFVKQLKDMGSDMDIEDNFNQYLGISIDDNPDGTKTMTQRGLIQKTLKVAKMEDRNPNWIPAHQVALGSDPDIELHDQSK
jgi:Reverse transcriptase (RNA-dependent DNA polymerase)